MGAYELDTTMAAMLRPVYRNSDIEFFIYYTGNTSDCQTLRGEMGLYFSLIRSNNCPENNLI